MAPVRCREIWRNLADLVEVGEVLPGRAPLERHLLECEACATLVARSRSVAGLMRSLPLVQAPGRLGDGIWQRLIEEDAASGRTSRLRGLLAGMPEVEAPVEVPAPALVEDPRVARLLRACAPAPAPASLDLMVRRNLSAYLWRRSRESRVLRFAVGALAAAAALLLCMALWAPAASPRPRLAVHDETAPPMGWESPESLQGRLHGLIDLQSGLTEAPGGRPRGR